MYAWMLVLTHLAVVLVLAGGTLRAQAPPLRISMDEAVGIALDQSPDVRLRALGIERSEAEIREARGALLPQVSTGTGFSRLIAAVRAGERGPGRPGRVGLLSDGVPRSMRRRCVDLPDFFGLMILDSDAW